MKILCVYLILLGVVSLQACEGFKKQKRQVMDVIHFNDEDETSWYAEKLEAERSGWQKVKPCKKRPCPTDVPDDRPTFPTTPPPYTTNPTQKPPTPKPDPVVPEKEPPYKNEIQKCMQKCYMTAEDDPVCGDDRVSYINQGHFACAKKCKTALNTFTRGPCLSGTSDEDIKQCLTKCPVSAKYDPVCGTDGNTYLNEGLLVCARSCGLKVELSSRGPCKDFTPVPTTTELNIGSTVIDETAQCIRNCPVSAEYNPICGTNGVTYANPGRMECAKQCGVVVDWLSKGRCDKPDSATTTTTPSIIRTTPSFIQQACLNRCPKSSEYKPVCGTDYVTYYNYVALYCAQYCGSNVNKLSDGECSKAPKPTTSSPEPSVDPSKDTTPTAVTGAPITTTQSIEVRKCIKNCIDTPEYNPVCGTDYVVYYNPQRLLCAQSCGVDVKMMRHGPCPKQPTTTTAATSAPIPPTVTVSTTTQSSAAKECVENCPSTPEYNPVCGTDYVTYKNPGKLTCAQIFCGLNVSMLRHGPCPKTKRPKDAAS